MTRGVAFILGSSWIFRHGVKQPLRRLGVSIVGEGDTFGEAFRMAFETNPAALEKDHTGTTLVVVLIEQEDAFLASLDQLCAARSQIPGAKLIALADPVSDANIVAATNAGVDALLSPKLSSRMLFNSLQLVLLDQKLFPSLTSGTLPQPVAATPSDYTGHTPDAGPTASETPEDGPVEAAPHANIHNGSKQPSVHGPKVMTLSALRPMRVDDHSPTVRPLPNMVNPAWLANASVVNLPLPGTPSERELQILRCVARGDSNKLIARELGIAETTVKVHVKSLLRKLGVSNRTQAAIWALQHVKNTMAPALQDSTAVGPNGASHTPSCNSDSPRSVEHDQHS